MRMLRDAIDEEIKKLKDPRHAEAEFDVMYPTGFLSLDFLNGYVVTVHKGDNNYKYNSIGIVDGSSTTIIGRSKCGKTTFALQAAANIIREFENGLIYYDDIEGGSVAVRRYTLTGFTPEEYEKRVIYRNAAVNAENFFDRIQMIYQEKMDHVEDYIYDTGKLDTFGKVIKKLVPTVYILDSLAMLTPEKISDEEKLSGSMSASAMAKTNTSVYKRIIPKLKAANIILFAINHINDAIEINPFQRKQAQIHGLKQGETLPGGKAAIYLANNMIRLDDNSKLKESEGMGISGSIVDFTIIKSRTNETEISVPMVFDVDCGFDSDLSLLIFMKERGVIPKGTYMTIEGYDKKFTQKTFKELLYTDIEFQNAFMKACIAELSKLLSDNSSIIRRERSSIMGSMINLATSLQSY